MYPLLRKVTARYLRPMDDRIFFLHLPKCGGQSLKQSLSALFPRAINLSPTASREAAERLGVSIGALRAQLLLYHMLQKRASYIGGHFDWSNAIYDAAGSDWQYITLMRDPVDKWFSQYFFNRHKQVDHFRTVASVEEFVESQEGVVIGRDYVQKLSERDSVEEACANLEKFTLVGLLEQLEVFEEQFRLRFGARLRLGHKNKNPAQLDSRLAAANDPGIRRVVERLCEPNRLVYERARELVESGFYEPAELYAARPA